MTSKERALYKECHEKFYYDGKNLRYQYRAMSRGRLSERGGLIAEYKGKQYNFIFVYGFGGNMRVHRVIFLMVHKYLPKYVDHADGDTKNNSITNLRDAQKFQNQANKGKQINSKNKYKGITITKFGRWRARVASAVKGLYFQKNYITEEEAAIAYDIASIKIFGDFARTNFSRDNYSKEFAIISKDIEIKKFKR